jgi:hypothetical protein
MSDDRLPLEGQVSGRLVKTKVRLQKGLKTCQA